MTTEIKSVLTAEDRTAGAFASMTARAQESAEKVNRAFELMKRGIEAAFLGISIGAIAEAARSAIEFGDEIEKASLKTGLAASTFSELAGAAKLADIDVTALTTAFKKMQVAISEAGSGGKEPLTALKALGLTFADLKRLAPDQQFELIADRISQLRDPADRARAAVMLFGKAGADLLPMFAQGAEGIRKAREEVVRLGGALTDEQSQKLSEADEAIKRLDASWKGFVRTLTAEASPALTRILDDLRTLMNGGDTGHITGNAAVGGNALAGARGGAGAAAIAKAMKDAADRTAKQNAKKPPGFGPPTSDEFFVPDLTPEQQITERMRKEQEELTRFSSEVASSLKIDLKGNEEAMKIHFETLSVYADQAARNMQDAFANFLFDPFKGGLKGMLASFANTIRRMVAEVAAARIFESASQKGGWLSNLLGGVIGGFVTGGGSTGTTGGSTAVHGARASGGDVRAGAAYLVNENTPRSEIFIPHVSGSIVPRSMGGSVVYAPQISVDSRSDRQQVIQDMGAIMQRSQQELLAMLIRYNPGLRV